MLRSDYSKSWIWQSAKNEPVHPFSAPSEMCPQNWAPISTTPAANTRVSTQQVIKSTSVWLRQSWEASNLDPISLMNCLAAPRQIDRDTTQMKEANREPQLVAGSIPPRSALLFLLR